MSNDVIRYDLLVQDAMRGVVRKVLSDASKNGLPGEHHFYITFRTGARGVKLSNRMKERFPEEMTIVLQFQFWDLAVTESAFEVGLSFGNVPEKLVIPFDAIVGFSDPSVDFGLKITMKEPEPEKGANDAEPAKRQAPRAPAKLPPRVADKPPRGAGSEPAEVKPAGKPKADKPAKDGAKDEAAKVVSIDAFRKKP
jgi:hypothetical protein